MQEKAFWPGWKTIQPIGKGGFGAVYEIQRTLLDTTESAALKVITIPQSDEELSELRAEGYDDESLAATYAQHLKSLMGEYSLMRKMESCPNIVRCDDVRYDRHPDGIGWDLYIRMELLTPILKAFPKSMDMGLVYKAGKDLCNALVTCSRFHVLHRDIKPQNIFISKNGDFKLGDFGIAKAAEHTMGGTKIGTYKYMAPEVYNNQPYGTAADIYSLGLVLYWMLNERRMPFLPLPPAVPSFQDEEQAKLRRFRGEPIPAPKNGSDALKAVVLKACAFEPADRYASAAEMLAALEQAEQQEANWEPQHQETQQPAPKTDDPELTQRVRKVPQDPNATVWVRPAKNDGAEKAEPKEMKQLQAQIDPKPKKKSTWLRILIAILFLGAVLSGLYFWIKISNGDFSKSKSTTEAIPEPAKLSLTWEEAAQRDTVSAGWNHTVALKNDGTVVVVGDNEYGQCNVESWTDIVAISAGSGHTVGLKSDGTLVAVGRNEYGQCDVESWTDIVAISAGSWHTVGLKSDGTLVAVGYNDDGRCDVENWTDIVAISAGAYHTVGLKSDGTLVAVGYNAFGQCNVANWTDIVAISAGSSHTVGLKADGTVVAVGYNDDGRCDVESWTDIVAISAGIYHTVGLKSDGTVVAVGVNDYGQCNVASWTDIVAISADGYHTVGLKANGTVVAVGDNKYGLCNVSNWSNIKTN